MIELAGSHQLGVDTARITEGQTYDTVARLFEEEHETLTVERLVDDMCEKNEPNRKRKEELLIVFIDGFLGKL